jgi:hypothetical protein
MAFLESNMKTLTRTTRKPATRIRKELDFDGLIDEIKKTLEVSQEFRDSLAVMFAVASSTTLPGTPIWTYVVGPPSSGKTTLSNMVAAEGDHVFSTDKFTGLLSGITSEKEDDGDNSLLKHIQGKVLLIKDFTTILGMSEGYRENIYGELRAAFDGSLRSFYRNDNDRNYEGVRFSVIACVTDEIHLHNKTQLGERFLKVEVMEEDEDHGEKTKAALSEMLYALTSVNEEGKKAVASDKMTSLGKTAGDFLRKKMIAVEDNKSKLPALSFDLTPDDEAVFQNLAEVVAVLRHKVQRVKQDGDVLLRPRPELPPRLSVQFMKLAACLGYVTGYGRDEVMRIVRKVAFDTCRGFQQDVFLAVCNSADGAPTKEMVAAEINTSPNTVWRALRDLQELQMVQYEERPTHGSNRGRNSNCWVLTEKAKRMAVTAGLMKEPVVPKTSGGLRRRKLAKA